MPPPRVEICTSGLTWIGLRSSIAEDVEHLTFAGKEIQGLVDELAGDEEPVRRAFDWVVNNIESDDAILAVGANETMRTGRGSRTVLLYTLLREMGIEVDYLMVNTAAAEAPVSSWPDPNAYSAELLRAREQGRWIWLDPAASTPKAGQISEELQGRPGLLLDPESPFLGLIVPAR